MSSSAAASPPSASAAGCSPLARSRSSRTAACADSAPSARACAHPLRVAVELGGLELEGQREQRLLGAVVQVALDPAPLPPLGGRPAAARDAAISPTCWASSARSRALSSSAAARPAAPAHGGGVGRGRGRSRSGRRPGRAGPRPRGRRGRRRAVPPHPAAVRAGVGHGQRRVAQGLAEHRLHVDAGVLGGERGADHPARVVRPPVETPVHLVLQRPAQREGQAGRGQGADRGGQCRATPVRSRPHGRRARP